MSRLMSTKQDARLSKWFPDDVFSYKSYAQVTRDK